MNTKVIYSLNNLYTECKFSGTGDGDSLSKDLVVLVVLLTFYNMVENLENLVKLRCKNLLVNLIYLDHLDPIEKPFQDLNQQ